MTAQTVTEWFRLTHVVGNLTGDWAGAKDAFVDEFAPNTNYGSDALLHLKATAANRQRTMVGFTVPPSTALGDAPVTSVVLYLYNLGNTVGADRIVVHEQTAHSFLEGTSNLDGVTWTNYDGVNAWAPAGGTLGDVLANIAANGAVAGWMAFDLTQLATNGGLAVGDLIEVILKWSAAAEGIGIQLLNMHSCESAVGAPAWPGGAPAWPVAAAGGLARPVIAVTYTDVVPTPISGFVVSPATDPTRAQFKYSANEDPDFAAYALRYLSGGGVVGTSSLVNLLGYGAAKIPAAGVTQVEMSPAATFVMNTVYGVKLYVEDASNTGINAAPSPEVTIIRPEVITITNATLGDSPRVHRFSNLAGVPNTFVVGDKAVFLVAGLGDNFTVGSLVSMPKAIRVDWADGTPITSFTPAYTTTNGVINSTDTAIPLSDPSRFVAGVDVVVITNGTNYDLGKVTSVSATGIIIDTDLGGYGQGVRYGYASGSAVYSLPQHVVTASNATWTPKVQLVNSLGYGSDFHVSYQTPAIATLAPIAVIDASIRSPLSTDTVRYTANRAYHRDSARPITSYRWSIDHAGTGGDPDADTTTTTVPYTTHNHGSGGTCRVALRVYDGTTFSATGNDYGDASNPQGDVSLTVAAESVLALPGGLTDGFNQAFTYRFSGGAKIAKVDGIDVRERVIMGDGKALIYVQLSGTAYSTPTSNVPIDVTTLHDAWTNKKGVTLSMPRSTSGVATLSGYIEDFQAHRTGVNSFDWTVDAVFDAPT